MASPIPDPNALRRDRKDDASWTTLPSKVDVKTPPWPLVGLSDREIELWEAIWKRPQALLWKQNSQEIEVALYVRNLSVVEDDGTAAQHMILIRQADNLLLTIPSMYKARVKIAPNEVKARGTKRKVVATSNGSSMRDRLKVVNSGSA